MTHSIRYNNSRYPYTRIERALVNNGASIERRNRVAHNVPASLARRLYFIGASHSTTRPMSMDADSRDYHSAKIAAYYQRREDGFRRAESILRLSSLRQAQSSWAGGEHSVRVVDGDTNGFSGGSNRVWSRNGKWSGNNSWVSVSLRIGWQLIEIAGVPTIVPTGYRRTEICRAFWPKQGRGFSVSTLADWVLRDVHVVAPTKGTATTRVEKMRRQRMFSHRISTGAIDPWVTVADARRAGNCDTGINSYVDRLSEELGWVGEVGAVRASLLREHHLGQIARIEASIKMATHI
jgi:hypothetical protein